MAAVNSAADIPLGNVLSVRSPNNRVIESLDPATPFLGSFNVTGVIFTSTVVDGKFTEDGLRFLLVVLDLDQFGFRINLEASRLVLLRRI